MSKHRPVSESADWQVPAIAPRIEWVALEAKNARTHSKRKVKDLANAIKAIGFIGVIVIDETGMILAGHAQHAAARLLGMRTVPTLCVKGLSDELVRAFVLADNKFSERAGWNREILAPNSLSCRPFCRPSISISYCANAPPI